MNYLLQRLREPSTWAGVSGMAGGIALLVVNPLDVNGWVSIFTGAGAVFVKEQK